MQVRARIRASALERGDGPGFVAAGLKPCISEAKGLDSRGPPAADLAAVRNWLEWGDWRENGRQD